MGSPYRSPKPAELESEVGALAPALELGAYELRLALFAPLPIVLLETPDVERARSLLALVRGRGHGGVACELSSIASSEQLDAPRSFAFDPDVLSVEGPPFGHRQVAYDEILVLIHALHTQEQSVEHREKKLSLGRAVLTGGLLRHKSRTVRDPRAREEREHVLYVMRKSGGGHLLLREQRLRYADLGARIASTVHENFIATMTALRERAPHACFDDRLKKARRAGANLRVTGTSSARTVTVSNASDTDVAAHLLAVAHLQGQA